MSANSSRLSPRQKMINLMYIVFLAMVALNVSSDVLSGFKHVEDALDASNQGVQTRNDRLFTQFTALHDKNPEKSGQWYDRARDVKVRAAALYALIDSVKWQVVREADGKGGDIHHIRNRENVESVDQVMIYGRAPMGPVLREAIESYRDVLVSYLPINDGELIGRLLSTAPGRTDTGQELTWEQSLFEKIPVAAAVTILSKLQGDVLGAEGQALSSLMQSVDAGDVRVNELSAFVIPESRNVMRGSLFQAHIVMAAVDTTQTPDIYIGDKLYAADKKGYYQAAAGHEGIQTLRGYLDVARPDGSREQLPFETSYFVSEPVATVSNTMMNVMYAGIDNPLSISVPGIAASQVSATMTGGTLTRQAGGWVARPKTVDQDAVVTVTATQGGRSMQVSQTAFRVRRLPDPTPYLVYTDAAGQKQRYRGYTPIAKAALLGAGGVRAAIDDGLLNVEFTVKSFRIDIFDSMGNDIPEDSHSAEFTERQITAIRRLAKGKKFYISRVKAVGPDGVERTLSPIEVVVN